VKRILVILLLLTATGIRGSADCGAIEVEENISRTGAASPQSARPTSPLDM
jgi:hypothetical protein